MGLWVGGLELLQVGAVGWGCGLEGCSCCGFGLWGSESVCVKSDQPVLTSVGTVTLCHCRSLPSNGQHRMTFVTQKSARHMVLGVHVLCQFELVYIKSDVP